MLLVRPSLDTVLFASLSLIPAQTIGAKFPAFCFGYCFYFTFFRRRMQSTSPIVGGRNVCPSRKYFEESTYVGDNEGEVESRWKCTFCNFFMRVMNAFWKVARNVLRVDSEEEWLDLMPLITIELDTFRTWSGSFARTGAFQNLEKIPTATWWRTFGSEKPRI